MVLRIIRQLISLSGLPGVPVHEYAHAWACRRCGVRVHQICYLRLGNPRGFVIHDRPDNALQHVMISVAPFLVCSFFSLLCGIGAQLDFQYHFIPLQYAEWGAAFLLWLGWASGANAFPSGGDAESLWRSAKSPEVGLFGKLLIIPVVGMIRLGQVGSYFLLDLLWGVFTVLLAPVGLLWFLSVQLG